MWSTNQRLVGRESYERPTDQIKIAEVREKPNTNFYLACGKQAASEPGTLASSSLHAVDKTAKTSACADFAPAIH